MDERTQVLLTTVLGAVVGGVFGWLYLTERGREVRVQVEPFFDNLADEIHQVEHTIDKARVAATEGRRALDDVLRPSDRTSWESRGVEQTPHASQAR